MASLVPSQVSSSAANGTSLLPSAGCSRTHVASERTGDQSNGTPSLAASPNPEGMHVGPPERPGRQGPRRRDADMTAALAEGKTPALTLSFVDEQGRPRCGEWVVIPRDVIARGLSHDSNTALMATRNCSPPACWLFEDDARFSSLKGQAPVGCRRTPACSSGCRHFRAPAFSACSFGA